jgi:hypothetical protein
MYLTQQKLKEWLYYNAETGVFTRLKHKRKSLISKEAGFKDTCGYILIEFDNKRYLAHRLAWLYVYGYFPDNLIDHINSIKSDNRLVNLREASLNENQYNSKKPHNNKSGVKGVSYHKMAKKWRAECSLNGKRIRLGLFQDIEDAKNAVKMYREKEHGAYFNHG